MHVIELIYTKNDSNIIFNKKLIKQIAMEAALLKVGLTLFMYYRILRMRRNMEI